MARKNRRYLRTLLLGIAAMGTLVWAAIEQFDIPPEEMLELFLASLLVLGVVIVAAAVVVALWQGLRYLLNRGGD